jgi:hypothetical protein
MLKTPLIIVLLLIVLVSVIPTIAEELPTINNPTAKQETGKTTDSKQNTKTQNQTSTSPLTTIKPTLSPPLQEIRENESPQYGKEQKYSWWYFSLTDVLLAIFTFALVVVGLFQFHILRGTLKATAKAAKAAQDSADALPAIERAYLFVNVVIDLSDYDPDEVFRIIPRGNKVKIIVTNHGKTPAILERITLTNNCFFTENFDLHPPFGTDIIINGRDRNYSTPFFIHSTEELQEIIACKSNLVCEGTIQYTDVFDISRIEVGFCWQWNNLFDRFNPCIEGNYRKQIKTN